MPEPNARQLVEIAVAGTIRQPGFCRRGYSPDNDGVARVPADLKTLPSLEE